MVFGSGILINKLSQIERVFSRLRVDPDQVPSSMAIREFLEKFNLTLPCGSECPIELTKKFSCTYSSDVFEVDLVINGVDPLKKILVADPFVTISRNSTHSCKMEYNGPKYLILDTSKGTKCKLTPHEVEQIKRPETK